MSESVISTMDNTAFFDNVTWLNQQNWQNYFGKTLPNGVIVNGSLKLSGTGYTLSGTMDITSSQNNIIVGTGAVMANGLYAENLLPVQTPHVTQAESTKFISTLLYTKFLLLLSLTMVIFLTFGGWYTLHQVKSIILT